MSAITLISNATSSVIKDFKETVLMVEYLNDAIFSTKSHKVTPTLQLTNNKQSYITVNVCQFVKIS